MSVKEVLDILDTCRKESPNINLIRHTRKMIEMSAYLNEDLREAAELFKFTTHGFAYRTCLRTLFSELEAKMFLFHELLLHMHDKSMLELSTEEILILKEQSCSVGHNGKIYTSQKFIPFKDNLLFTLSLSERFLNKDVFRDTTDPKWQDVLALIEIRNRITHPKKMSDLQISDREVKIFDRAQDWLRTAFETMLISPALLAKITAKLKKKSIRKTMKISATSARRKSKPHVKTGSSKE